MISTKIIFKKAEHCGFINYAAQRIIKEKKANKKYEVYNYVNLPRNGIWKKLKTKSPFFSLSLSLYFTFSTFCHSELFLLKSLGILKFRLFEYVFAREAKPS